MKKTSAIPDKNVIGLALGSGGARGLAHIGVIKALEENHIPINVITGTSIGAFIGGIYASGIDANAMEKIIRDVNKVMVAKIMIPKLFSPGFIDNKRVIAFIKEIVGDVRIENLKIPFACVATDMITGREVIFNKGPLADAIMASIAIPTIFQPVILKNQYLLDGGLSNPLPISIAKEMKVNKIIAVNVSPNPERITQKLKSKRTKEARQVMKMFPALFSNLLTEGKKLISKNELKKEIDKTQLYSPTLMNVFLQSISISTNNLINQQIRHARPDILISPKIEDFDMLEFYKGTEIVKCGHSAAQKAIGEIKDCLSI